MFKFNILETLNQLELKVAMKTMGFEPTKSEVNSIFTTIDIDQKGLINFN
jgi:Ca2+-binding EF-hand superfamily protein